ncbi:hypothetical protein ACOSP7_004436 [Xanthoceras sorbifolium]
MVVVGFHIAQSTIKELLGGLSINFSISIMLDRDNYVYCGLKLIPPKYVEVCLSDGSKETVVNKEFTRWRKADKLFLCWLLSTVSPSIISKVTGCVSAYELWNTLKYLFSQQPLAKVLKLRQHLQSVKKGSSSVSDFMLKVKGIGDALRGAGEVVQNKDLLLSILNGIGREYNPVAVLIAKQSHTIDIQEAQYMLMVHEQRLHT